MELNLVLFGVICALIGIIYATLTTKINKLENKQENHEKRIQKVEDVHGPKFDTLEKKIDKLEISIQTLSENLHKEKNEEHSLTIAITNLYKFLEKNEKHNQ